MAKILVFDIETAPILAHVWDIWDQNVGLNQIAQDWHIMSWAAKWVHEKKVLYMDQRSAKDLTDDKKILEALWKLLDEADIVVGQNSKAFDVKKVNARFIIHGMKPPSPYQQIDTRELARKHFAFTSNKLEYMADKLNKNKKSQHKKFSGFDLWRECMKGNISAWREMEKYNKADVIATEELYKKLAPWGVPGINLNAYSPKEILLCPSCGKNSLNKSGYKTTLTGRFQRYHCTSCGSWTQGKINLLSKEKRESMKGK